MRPGRSGPRNRTGTRARGAVHPRPWSVVRRGEPDSFADKALRRTCGRTQTTSLRVFNAGLVFKNERETPNPYLAEALPQLKTNSWRVFPDGRVETTYRRLKPGLAATCNINGFEPPLNWLRASEIGASRWC